MEVIKLRLRLNLKKSENKKGQKDISSLHPCNLFDNKIKKYIEYYGDDLSLVCKNYKHALNIFLPIIAIIVIFGVLRLKLLLLSAIPLALIAYLYPLLYVWSRAEEHKKVINTEAPFIAIIAYANSLVDKGLNHTLRELSQIKELKVPKVELDFLDKMTTYMNMSFAKALERRAIVHNGDLLGKLYNSYLSALELGITIRDRLKDVLRELLEELKNTYKAYVDKTAELSELEFALFLLVPMILIGFSFTFKVSLFELFSPLLLVPLIIFLISSIQPSIGYEIKYGRYMYGIFAIPAIFLIPGLNLEYKVFALIGIILAMSYFVYDQITLANELEQSLPILLKEVSEYLKIGYSVQSAILRVKLSSKRVSKVIETFAKRPELINSPSKLFNVTFKLLLIVAKTGTSSTALEELANSISEIVYSKSNLIRQLRLFDVLNVITPVMLWLSFEMFAKMSTFTIPGLAVISAYSLASNIIFSKISRFTILYFPSILLTSIIIAILSVLPPTFL